MLRTLALLLALAPVAAACGGSEGVRSDTAVETRAAAPGLPAGFTMRVVKEQGFSIALPKRWRSIDGRQALRGGLDDFKKANPQLAGALDGLARPNSPLKLLALDPSDRGDFLTNVNVLVTRVPSSISFEEWTAVEVGEIRRAVSVEGFRREDVQLPPGRALHLTYRAKFNRAGGAFTALIDQYMVKKEDSLYIISYTTKPSTYARERQIFADSARSFRLTR
jgi:hypothetical protein